MNIDQVFLVKRNSGSYDDFVMWVDRIYLSEDKAIRYRDEMNEKLKRIKDAIPKSVFDEEGELDFDHINWSRYNKILDQGEFYIHEFQITHD